MILCYLDTNKKNISIEGQRRIVMDYVAARSDMAIDIFIENHSIPALSQSMTAKENTIVVANVVCLGVSLREIRDNIAKLISHQSTIVSVSEGYIFAPNKETADLLKGLDCALTIRSSVLSIVTKSALAERKASGVALGRKSRNKKRALDDKIEEIISRKMSGETNLQIAKSLGVSQMTLYAFYKAHPEIKQRIAGAK